MKKFWSEWKGYLFGVVCFGAVLCYCMGGLLGYLKKGSSENAAVLEAAISRAVVQCYAIEGIYPPSVEYLEENYGIVIDREQYAVFYDGFASNIMPQISVVVLN